MQIDPETQLAFNRFVVGALVLLSVLVLASNFRRSSVTPRSVAQTTNAVMQYSQE